MLKLTKRLFRSIFLILSALCIGGGQYALQAQPSSSSERPLSPAFSQASSSEHSSIEIYFRGGSSEYEPRYRSNASNISRFVESTNALSRGLETGKVKITFSASASPEGSAELNARLSRERLGSAAAALMAAGLDPGFFDGDNVSSSFTGTVPLGYLAEMTESSSFRYKSSILNILDDDILEDEEKIARLRAAEGGRCWNWLSRECFPGMRSFRAVVRIERDAALAEVEAPLSVHRLSVESPRAMGELAPRTDQLEKAVEAIADDGPAEEEWWTRRLTLKTNALGLGLLLANAAAEVGITEHLTFHMPVYYSAVNYFSRTVKFRSLAVQPELRYYIPKVDGLFAGAHMSVASFNLAADGAYRLQDQGGDTPLLGGGVSVGYRLQFRAAPRWGVEFAVGAGAYRFDYDRFVNEPNGPYVDTVNRTYIGIDNLSVSITYDFELGKVKKNREGRR